MTDIRSPPYLWGLATVKLPTSSVEDGENRSIHLREEDEDAGIGMEEVLASDRGELAVAEEADQRPFAEALTDEGDVVIRRAVEPLAAPGAVEVDAERRLPVAERGPHAGEHRLQVVVGRLRVADLELDRLADEHGLCERDRARFPIEPGEGPYEEVAAPER